MALTDKLSAIGDAIRAKTGKDGKLTLAQMPVEIAGISGGTLGPISVTENGTYNAAYEVATVTWDENTEYDFTVEAEGIPVRVKKLAGFSVPDDVKAFSSPDYAITAHMNGEDQSIPLKEMELSDFYGAGYLSDDLLYAVVWIKNAALFNETVGDTVFEDNSVYVTDFLWVVSDGEMSGCTFTLTAPGKKLDGISSVTVEVQADTENQYKYITENGDYFPDEGYDGFSEVMVNVQPKLQAKSATANGTVTPDSGYDGLSQVTVNVPVPDGYVKPSGTKLITENGTHDVSGYAQAEVAVESTGGGSAELNIAYGDTEPTDTSKLWVKGNEPNKVIIRNDFDGAESLVPGVASIPVTVAGTSVGVVGTKAYLFGGYYEDGSSISRARSVGYIFDPTTGMFSSAGRSLAMFCMGCAVVGSKIYFFGGRSGTNNSDIAKTIYMFDAETNNMGALSITLGTALYGIAAAAVGNKVYLFGGAKSSTSSSADIRVFDPKTNSISTIGKLDEVVAKATAVAVGTKIYLFGGSFVSSTWNKRDKIRMFDTITGKVTVLSARLSQPAEELGASAVGSKIYLFGGDNNTAANESDTIQVFDTETESISKISTTLPMAMFGISAATIGTKVYLFGGTRDNETYSSVNAYVVTSDLATGTMQLVPAVTGNKVSIVNSDNIQMKIGIGGAYLGNEDGQAEPVDTYAYTGIEKVESINPDYSESAQVLSSGTELTASVNCFVGDLVVAAITTRDTLTLSDGWTLISTSETNSTDTYNQRLSWAWKFAENTTESITVTQASEQRLYINMVALQGATGVIDNGYFYRDDDTNNSMTVAKPDGLVLWGLTTPMWSTTAPYPIWTASNDAPIIQLGTATQSRLGIALDQTNEASITFQSGSTSSMIIGSLTVQGMDKFYADSSYNRRVWENVNTGEKLTFRIDE